MPSRKKILLVEDDNPTQEMMIDFINALGADVDVTDDGVTCCKQLEEDPSKYGVILMDIHLPKMSGVEATSKIRAVSEDPPRNLPIYAITADEAYHDNATVISLGMTGFIKKPVIGSDLFELVEKYCKSA
jgi:CheY-like chemotaxis protein